MFETSPDLSVETVAEIVRLALAPVFLLSGIGAFLNVLASRLSRIVDRSRDIEPLLLVSRGAEHDRWINDLKILDRRMSLINWATGLVGHLGDPDLPGRRHAVRGEPRPDAARARRSPGCSSASMLAIGAAFAVFLIETMVAARAVRIRSELLQHTVDEED